MVTTTSERLTPFLAAHEGYVSKAYRCPAGVITIGRGFTGRSKVFAEYWRTKTGHALRMGDTITRAECDAIMIKMLAAEYSPPVARALPNPTQHAFDGATSVSFNCGPGALKWKWAQALGRGDVKSAAALLRNTAVTANGRRLAGLVRRRKEEAALIESGNYGHQTTTRPASESTGNEEIKQYQTWLKTLGYYSDEIDGLKGPMTREAVKAFQRKSDLVVDGTVGPATRAALIRAVDAKRSTQGSVVVGGGAGAGDAITSAPPIDPAIPIDPVETVGTIGLDAFFAFIIVAAIAWAGLWLWRNRGRLTGRRVPT